MLALDRGMQSAGIITLTFKIITGRTMRVIVASGYVDETDVDTYRANPYSIGLARPELESTIKFWSVLFDPLRTRSSRSRGNNLIEN